jgi:hypothetical protein
MEVLLCWTVLYAALSHIEASFRLILSRVQLFIDKIAKVTPEPDSA